MAAVVAVDTGAKAEETPLLAEHGDWQAFKTKQNGKDVCFVSSKPVDSEPKNVRRGDIFFLVSYFQDGSVKDQVQVLIGYPFKTGSTAHISIDGKKKFELFTDGENAWARKAETDSEIVAAMKRGAKAVVTGTSQRGTDTTDVFSLKGITAAISAVMKACNV
ncbi:invasion associated locus B family protein [Zavarzinia compransoris]|uniref:invasion associated locus B family protein n=1 Tax=Zavarzinia marina TaxID=2911065 RepID=UPI001F258837|nr:invasion associated locus B family protein [Zavarzinia marina]MCF4165400.1 invasion associated locus B family protein [Zavarzinia marina]